MHVDAEHTGNGDKQHVAIGWRSHHRFDTDVAIGAGSVIHHEGLTEHFGEIVGQYPCQQIDRATGRAGGDDFHRACGPALRQGVASESHARQHQNAEGRDQARLRTAPARAGKRLAAIQGYLLITNTEVGATN